MSSSSIFRLFLALYRRLVNVSNGDRGLQEHNKFPLEKFLLMFVFGRAAGTFLLVLRIRMNERGGLLSCEVRVAHAISVFQNEAVNSKRC